MRTTKASNLWDIHPVFDAALSRSKRDATICIEMGLAGAGLLVMTSGQSLTPCERFALDRQRTGSYRSCVCRATARCQGRRDSSHRSVMIDRTSSLQPRKPDRCTLNETWKALPAMACLKRNDRSTV